MAEVAATRASGRRVREVADATNLERDWWRDSEIEVIVERDCEQRRRRPQRNLKLNVRRTAGVLRKRSAIGGDGTASTVQLARDLYPDVRAAWDAGRFTEAYDLAMNKAESVRRWLKLLTRQNVIAYTELPGKGFRWRFQPVPEAVARMASARGCSSVGWSVRRGACGASGGRTAPVMARRWCPAAGRGVPYVPPPAPRFFSALKFEGPGALPPYGGEGTSGRACAREAPPGDRGAGDAPSGRGEAGRGAALERLRRAGSEGGVAALRDAALGGADPVAVAIVGWELATGRHPRLSAQRRSQLERSAAQMDRVACFGAGQLGAGACRVLDMIADAGREGALEQIASLGKFVCELRSEAREWRRQAKGLPRVVDSGQRQRRRAAAARGKWSWN